MRNKFVFFKRIAYSVCVIASIGLIATNSFAQSRNEDSSKLVAIIAYLLLDEPQISIRSSTTVAEGDNGTKIVNLVVSVSPFIESSVDIQIDSNGSAQQGIDYIAPPLSRITFANEINTKTLSFEIIGDTVDETTESFTVRLFDATGVELSSQSSATITIIDDESLYNDTGLQIATNLNTGIGSDCRSTDTSLTQDCSSGRDFLEQQRALTKLGRGQAGFDFTKLGASGQALNNQNRTYSATGSEPAGTLWSCVRDNHTGLVWEVKTIGGVHDRDIEYQWGGVTAIGRDRPDREGTYLNDNSGSGWDALVNASNSGNGLCGITDWRVPSIKALSSIVNYGQPTVPLAGPPMIDTAYFPNTADGSYWTATPEASRFDRAWEIRFNNGSGSDSMLERSSLNRVRLVSGDHEPISNEVAIANGDQVVKNYITNTTPNSRYVISADSTTVIDSNTGLMWQRCQLGLSGNGCTSGSAGEYDWQQALAESQSNTLAGHTDWRLPNIAEMRTLNAYDRSVPAINSVVFPNTESAGATDQHSSSPSLMFASGLNFVWFMQSSNGSDRSSTRTQERRVRLVRGGLD